MASEETLTIVRKYLIKLVEGQYPVQGLVLYGSHARGGARPESDIDVLVLLEDRLTPGDIDRLWGALEHERAGIDTRIETWPVTKERFETDQVSPLIIAARREGILIAA